MNKISARATDMASKSLRDSLRSLVYPGLDLHTRNRASLRQYWRTGPRDVLDAGSGNGYFSWLAYQSGARVVAINFDAGQIEKAREFLLGHKGADPARLQFERRNLYDLSSEVRKFDEIICFEVLEHLRRDVEVVKEFYRVLRPGGVLHLCCPNKAHPRHRAEVLDSDEKGGHVRAGYTEAEYRALLEPVGFKIERVVGIGPGSVCIADSILRAVRAKLGDAIALPLLPAGLLTVWLARRDPPIPFSLYVTAARPTQ